MGEKEEQFEAQLREKEKPVDELTQSNERLREEHRVHGLVSAHDRVSAQSHICFFYAAEAGCGATCH